MIVISKPIKNVLNILLTLTLLLFAYIYIAGIVKQVNFEDISINFIQVSLALLLLSASYMFFSVNWVYAARIFKSNAGLSQGLVFIASQPYKYLPTSLFVFSSRAIYAKKLGLTLKQGSLAQIIENMSIFASNLILFAIFYIAIYNVAIAFCMSVLVMILLWKLSYKEKILLKFKNKSLEVGGRQVVVMLLATTAGWLFNGAAFILLNISLRIDINIAELLAANTIAFSLGILAFFAPGGLGVREMVYKFFLVSNVAIIYWRILVFAVDMLLGAAAIVLIRKKTQQLES